MKAQLYHIFILILIFGACATSVEKPVIKGNIYFETVPSTVSGLDFSNNLVHKDDLNIIEYLYYYNGGGVAIGDINNDGLEDLFFTANQSADKLYINKGNLKFEEVGELAGMRTDSTWSTGVSMADINNDGFLDIYVTKVGNYKSLQARNELYINQKDGTFIESAREYGLDFSGFSTHSSFFDYDNDGDLDMYLLNHAVHTPRSYGDIGLRETSNPIAGDRLFENQLDLGIKEFKDVTNAAGIYSSALGYGLALTTSDINGDGLIDIYVGNDFHENDYLYINQGDKTFKESIGSYMGHNARFTMGVDIADFNHDQNLDIMTLDMMPYDHEILLSSGGEDSDKVSEIKRNYGFGTQYARNTLQLNNGNSFSDIALMTQTHATDWSWSVLIQDYDNDGFNDIYVTNGIYKRPNDLQYINYLSNINFAKYDRNKQNEMERKLIEEMPAIKLPNVVFNNQGNYRFRRLTKEAGLLPSYSNGAAYGDLDNDGDLDVIVNNINQDAFLLENKSSDKLRYNYISISLIGDSIFMNPTGAKVIVYTHDQKYLKELTVTRGFQSSVTQKLHFGLGEHHEIDSVEIQWLDGKVQMEHNIASNQSHDIIRNSQNFVVKDRSKQIEFNSLTRFPYIHLENNFQDYERESLMPEKLSAEGPNVIKADFNGDQLDDLFIGGAKYQAPSLFIQQKDGNYLSDKRSDFMKDVIFEDVDATVFDLDNDGDLDLYVMSGGNEKTEGDPFLEDRIYINDGNALFTRLNAPLIKTNGGSVSSGDYNGDGFEDLFIGNRSIPGGYGLSPNSYILKNNGKSGFTLIKELRFGMVTDSQWVDINGDDLLDLVIVGDWMPITIYINKGRDKFENETKQYGLEDSFGMWNTVLVADLNGNGKQDIIGGNAGLNLKFQASVENPIKLFIDDFDENGQPDPIIFYNFFGNDIPFASRDKLADQIPSLKKKFLNYKDFAKIKGIKELIGKEEDEILEVKKINELRSMVYIHQEGSFLGKPLPMEAQMSAIEDLYLETDKEDKRLIFVGNYLDYTAELGQSNANPGGVVRIDADDNFKYEASLNLPLKYNARRLVKIGLDQFLVVANNDKSYIIELEKKKKDEK